MNWRTLRKKYPKFVFEDFRYEIKNGRLRIFFYFSFPKKFSFISTLEIEKIKKEDIKRVGERVLKNLIFHLGLIEMLNYWKLTCSPSIEIRPGTLSLEQKSWWKSFIIKGMGQFFFENKINFLEKNFLEIRTEKEKSFEIFEKELNDQWAIVPLGGGKDSIVTLEYLKILKKKVCAFVLNPKKVHKRIIKISKPNYFIFAKREIDRKLFKLNKKGFLNGHVPFTAYLSFLAILIAILKNYKFVAFSNEKSANEGNLKYLGRIINHQYSKSLDFEIKMRNYSKKYLAKDIEYFSLLRNLYEIEIVKLFTQFPQYFNTFLSCNRAFSISKKNPEKWCLNCPKCLFLFATFFAFLGKEALKIFKKNLFENKKLIPIMLQLIGKKGQKPFECVGTFKEARFVFQKSCEIYEKERKRLPILLAEFKKHL